MRIYRQHELESKVERAGCFLRGSHHAHAFHSPYWWLKCAYGLDNPDAAPVKRYHDFLCHLIEHNPRWAEAFAWLGGALKEQGRHDEALAALRRYAELRPEDQAMKAWLERNDKKVK